MHGGESNGLSPFAELRRQVDRHDAEIYGRGPNKGLRELVTEVLRQLGLQAGELLLLRRLLIGALVLLVLLVLSVGAGAWALLDIAKHTKPTPAATE